MRLRTMVPDDFDEVADLIFHSTNFWYRTRLGREIFQGNSSICRIFCETYEKLDPGCGLVVEDSGKIAGSCFFHPRETHSSLGIMNVCPSHFGRGVAGMVLRKIVELAENREMPLRLVSSALNLDSFSLYSRSGFVLKEVFQDLIIDVPEDGLPERKGLQDVRSARLEDSEAMGRIENEVEGIQREKDYRYFLTNSDGIWKTLVSLDKEGQIDGWLVSSDHPASCMIGPGISVNSKAMESLLIAQLKNFRGRKILFLLPVKEQGLIAKAYSWGARNCELHFSQVRGFSKKTCGVIMPSFLPESA